MSISLKLVLVVTLCMALAAGGVGFIAWNFFQGESVAQVKRDTAFSTQIVGQDLSREINSQAQKMASFLHAVETNDANQIKGLATSFNSQDTLLTFGVYKPGPSDVFSEVYFSAKKEGLQEFGLQPASFGSGILPATLSALKKHPNGLAVFNSSLLLKKPIFTLAFFNDKHWLVKSEIRMDVFKEDLKAKDGQVLFLVDSDGIVFGSSNPATLSQGINVSNSGIFAALKQGASSGQLNYIDDQGTPCVGAFNVLPSGIAVIAQVDQGTLLASLEHLRYRVLLVSLMALGMAWIIIMFYSGQMIRSLTYLYNAFAKVSAGHFQTTMEVVSGDEIGILAQGFKKMVSKLQDREKLKGTLVKFAEDQETDKILSGEVKLSTEKRRMTVLVFEVYDFALDASSSEEAFRQLNSFWNEVNRTVKKYLGFIDYNDTQMMKAYWGALGQINDEGSSALSAALEIRKVVGKVNERRSSKNLSTVKFGIGIHTGDVLPGYFGFDQRSSYTFAGPDVVFASRVASLNHEFRSDILVSEDTQILLKNKGFVFGPSISGYEGEINVRQVIGRKKSDGEIETDLSRAEQDSIKEGAIKATPTVKSTVTSFAQIEQKYNEVHGAATVSPPREQHVSPNTVTQMAPTLATQSLYNFNMTEGGAAIVKTPQTLQPMFTASQFIVETNANPPPEMQWFLMRSVQTGIVEGPFELNVLRKIAEQPGFPTLEAYAYRPSDTMMTPLMQVPGLSRRQAAPPIPQTLAGPPADLLAKAREEEWLIQREDGRVYGPYGQEQLSQFLENGQMSRTTHCWRKGMSSWVYAFQLPGLDRRGSTPPPPPLPIPAKAS